MILSFKDLVEKEIIFNVETMVDIKPGPLFLTGCAHIPKRAEAANTPPSRISGQSPAHFTKKITRLTNLITRYIS